MFSATKNEAIGLCYSAGDVSVANVRCNIEFICSCGKLFTARVSNVLYGTTKSCGCAGERHGKSKRHGDGASPEYYSWQSMKQRCLNKNADGYHRYGGRGISICDKWISSFEAFLADMGSRPEGFSLERIDQDGNYEPSNCKWASPSEQSRNRCDNRILDLFGEKIHLADACVKYGISRGALTARLRKMTAEQAVTMPLKSRRPRKIDG